MQVTYFLKKIASTWPERSSGLCQKRAFGNVGCPKSLNLKLSLRIFVTYYNKSSREARLIYLQGTCGSFGVIVKDVIELSILSPCL
jgi:hypothetical protein